MSIHISSAVWKAPIPNAGAKIVLLALADIANHEGVCWPSNGTLCAMTSLSKTTVKEHLRALAEQGIIDVFQRTAPNGRQTSNVFTIHAAKLPKVGEGSESDPMQEGAKSDGGGGEIYQGGGGEKQPPMNHQKEPPTEPTQKMRGKPLASAAKEENQKMLLSLPETLPDFPSASMVAAWNRLCPTMRKIQALAGSRMKSARSRWKELGATLPDWEAFCQRIEASDFLSGRQPGKGGRTFTADFDWCIMPANAIKIREGKYDNVKEKTPTPNTYGW